MSLARRRSCQIACSLEVVLIGAAPFWSPTAETNSSCLRPSALRYCHSMTPNLNKNRSLYKIFASQAEKDGLLKRRLYHFLTARGRLQSSQQGLCFANSGVINVIRPPRLGVDMLRAARTWLSRMAHYFPKPSLAQELMTLLRRLTVSLRGDNDEPHA